jgi:hypothetical protein
VSWYVRNFRFYTSTRVLRNAVGHYGIGRHLLFVAKNPENFINIGKVIIVGGAKKKKKNRNGLVLIRVCPAGRPCPLCLLRLEHVPWQIVCARAPCPYLYTKQSAIQDRRLFLGDLDISVVDGQLVHRLPRMPPSQHQLGCTLSMSPILHDEYLCRRFQCDLRLWYFDSPTALDLDLATFLRQKACDKPRLFGWDIVCLFPLDCLSYLIDRKSANTVPVLQQSVLHESPCLREPLQRQTSIALVCFYPPLFFMSYTD